jgi:CHAT domain-containing protein
MKLLALLIAITSPACAAAAPTLPDAPATAAGSVAKPEITNTPARVQDDLDTLGLWSSESALARLAKALPANSVCVEYRAHAGAHSGSDARDEILEVRVLRADGSLATSTLGMVGMISTPIARWRQAIGYSIARPIEPGEPAPDLATDGEALREIVLDPVLAAAREAKTLFVKPVGDIHRVPLDALPSAKGDGSLVGDAVSIAYVVSFHDLERSNDGTLPSMFAPSLLAVGGIDYGTPASTATPRWRALPRTRDEADEIAILFRRGFERDATLLSGPNVTKLTFADRARTARFVHLATYGWCDLEGVGPLDRIVVPGSLCGLALTGVNVSKDGALTADELAHFDLSHCELAVLSASDTHAGIVRAGQGVQSLCKAAHDAGARAVLGTLWAIDGSSVRELMSVFYTRLWIAKRSKLDALWDAKRAMREKGLPARVWAPWVLIGDPR